MNLLLRLDTYCLRQKRGLKGTKRLRVFIVSYVQLTPHFSHVIVLLENYDVFEKYTIELNI